MSEYRDQWSYTVSEAEAAAQQVADHDPDLARDRDFVPADELAAAASVRALQRHLERLPKFVRRAMEGAASGASQLSDDRLQGIAELIQNADDLGATDAFVTIDQANSRLLFAHNGSGLTLHDVLALAVPWLSLKVTNAAALGRFGIGLSTLHSLSDTLDVHEGPFHVRFAAQVVEPVDDGVRWPGGAPDDAKTVFAIPFEAGTVTIDHITTWLTHWGDAGLVFLADLRTVSLLDETGLQLARLAIERGTSVELATTLGPLGRRTATASDGHAWRVYSWRAPTPTGKRRVRKAHDESTLVALAFPQSASDCGHLHVGLPVRPIGLPFRVLAQFDPTTSRRDINDTEWNLSLIPLIAQLWTESVLDLFATEPSQGWAAVPLAAEFGLDERTVGAVRDAFSAHLMREARLQLAGRLLLEGGNGERLPLRELAYETPTLEGILQPADIERVADTEGSITSASRSSDTRWRMVLGELSDVGADLGPVVSVRDALVLLEDSDRPADFVADLAAVALDDGLGDELWSLPCLVFDGFDRSAPEDLGDLDRLLPDNAGDLWAVLHIGRRLHPNYIAAAGWERTSDWLRDEGLLLEKAANPSALTALAAAGRNAAGLPAPLTDEQAVALRDALEDLSDEDRARLASGIGRAVKFAATTYDATGKLIHTFARPCDAYIIERETNSWNTAAARTAGLVWLHRRYQDELRTPSGREGLGSQRLFRLLGAETAPRLVPHPDAFERYAGKPRGLPSRAHGSPQRRIDLLLAHNAAYTVGDYASPDLDRVLRAIARERDAGRRRKRALAVLASLSRAWDRLGTHAKVMAAVDYYDWIDRGSVEAWWLSIAATIPWLSSQSGAPAAPADLRVRTVSTEALYGDDPERYLDSAYAFANPDVLEALGVARDAGVDELIEKLEQIREEIPNEPRRAADLAAPVYKALASLVTHGTGSRRSLGALPPETVLARFRRGEGLVATNLGWRSPSVALVGDEIFGDYYPFVPPINGAEALWSFLRIPQPGADHARAVLKKLAARRVLEAKDRMVMLDSLRILAGAKSEQRGVIRRMPVWIGDQWQSKRPVYAIANPLIAEALRGRLPIWTPGGELGQLESLVDALGLTRIDATQAHILEVEGAVDDPELTDICQRAIVNLRADLALGDPAAEASLTVSWDHVAHCQLCLLPGVRVEVADPSGENTLNVDLDAWFDAESVTLYVANAEAAGRLGAGGYAVAAAFTGNTRSISHAWVVAWAEALEGHEAEKLATAASEAADRRRERDDADDARLREFAERTKRKRNSASSTSRSTEATAAQGSAGSEPAPEKRPLPPRQLVDTRRLILRNSDGEMVGEPRRSPGTKGTTRHRGGLSEPDTGRPNRRSDGGRGPANYTSEEREQAGMDLVRRVLGADSAEMIDIRHQRHVGADAIDDLRNFYELKVHSGPIPDEIRLQDSEVQRAYETESFFLVVVGNVERGGDPPEVRVITDPLGRLDRKVVGHVTLSGVQTAKALRYVFEEVDLASAEIESTGDTRA